ncbi:DMT family transporter [Sphingobacterium olei]|uniref:DMT family transporter n=1 Tax=Sphingobacterium olei TaxID=2571155 RepID=A0A4U0P5U3_9SPHI|nr:DMT family transporter [Sphingobacterium olei]TJZ62777.1 DMT family transporter [Sphingobacterium olei]
MIFVFLSVLFSVTVSIVIKVARSKQVDTQQLVLWNYPVAVLMTYFLLKPDLSNSNAQQWPFMIYISLAILLPTLFIFIALAIRTSGIVKTDIAQRLSLFIPLIASFVVFGEEVLWAKMIGIGVGIVAIICSISWNKQAKESRRDVWIYPLVVFIGMGIIDVLFKQIAQYAEVPYLTSMFIVFVLSMLVAFAILGYQIAILKRNLDKNAISWGLLLGVFNFGNIYLYMKAHRALPDNPSIVFTAMNIGVIVLGGIVGIVIFKEKLSKINQIGLFLAIISVLLIAYL